MKARQKSRLYLIGNKDPLKASKGGQKRETWGPPRVMDLS